MEYEYCASDPKHFAQALRYNAERRMLLWDSAPGHDSILVQTPFGQSAEDIMDALCKQLSHIHLGSGVFVELMPGRVPPLRYSKGKGPGQWLSIERGKLLLYCLCLSVPRGQVYHFCSDASDDESGRL